MRRMWDAGLAHRDIKPANLLVRDGQLLIIDSAFAQLRPSPWRQAVDLANMMLVLALRTDAPRVYARAKDATSTTREIAEAFAATRGLTMPSQLRRMLRSQGEDLHAEFLTLMPYQLRPSDSTLERPAGRAERRSSYSARPGAIFAVQLIVEEPAMRRMPRCAAHARCRCSWAASTSIWAPRRPSPNCDPRGVRVSDSFSPAVVLMAQSVPSATLLPCVNALPVGWSFARLDANDRHAKFWLSSDRGGDGSVSVSV